MVGLSLLQVYLRDACCNVQSFPIHPHCSTNVSFIFFTLSESIFPPFFSFLSSLCTVPSYFFPSFLGHSSPLFYDFMILRFYFHVPCDALCIISSFLAALFPPSFPFPPLLQAAEKKKLFFSPFLIIYYLVLQFFSSLS